MVGGNSFTARPWSKSHSDLSSTYIRSPNKSSANNCSTELESLAPVVGAISNRGRYFARCNVRDWEIAATKRELLVPDRYEISASFVSGTIRAGLFIHRLDKGHTGYHTFKRGVECFPYFALPHAQDDSASVASVYKNETHVKVCAVLSAF